MSTNEAGEDKCDSHDEAPNFSDLPTIIWVDIMKYLPLEDRNRLSQTCKSILEAFNHPSLWHTAVLHLTGRLHPYISHGKWKSSNYIPNLYFPMVNKYGRFFQNLTLSISGYLTDSFGPWNDLMEELAKQCRLESLTLHVGNITNEMFKNFTKPDMRNILPIVSFVKKAFRMRFFHLESWPMHSMTVQGQHGIFNALMTNEKIKDLEHITLFQCKKKHWCERIPVLPSPEIVTKLVGHFRNLTVLGLRSPMLCSEILIEFSEVGRTKLKLLQIFVTYVPNNDNLCMPEILNEAWEEFRRKNPQASVECVIISRVPNFELANMLKPSCPLQVISLRKYAHCDPQLIDSLADKYATRLRTFECYLEPSTACDTALINLVSKCSLLDSFLFFGSINHRTVEQLASVRGNSWISYKIMEKCISFTNLEEHEAYDDDDDDDDDQVIAKDSSGNYYITRMDKYLRQESDNSDSESKLDNLSKSVSSSLGCTWRAVSGML